MAHKIKINSSSHGQGTHCFNEETWNLLQRLDNGLFQVIENKYYLKTSAEEILTVTMNSGEEIHKLSSSYSLDKTLFNTHIGLLPDDSSFLFFESKNPKKFNEFIIANVRGGLVGTTIQIFIDFENKERDFETT